jgi:general secretion pathway protein D
MRKVGVRMEVEPTVGADGYTIDLNLAPEVVEFEGFINYGSPIQTTAQNALGVSTTLTLTENVINQPVFSIRTLKTSVTVFDGSTVVMGGLIREDVQDVEDKVPLLGDIPILGRLFQSKAEDHFKRNLMIFVTARLIDPSGADIRQPVAPPSSGDAGAGGAVNAGPNPLLPSL